MKQLLGEFLIDELKVYTVTAKPCQGTEKIYHYEHETYNYCNPIFGIV